MNSKGTQYTSFETIVANSFRALFSTESSEKLINYEDLKLVNPADLNFLNRRELNLIHVPTLLFFFQYVGALSLTLSLMGILTLGLFSADKAIRGGALAYASDLTLPTIEVQLSNPTVEASGSIILSTTETASVNKATFASLYNSEAKVLGDATKAPMCSFKSENALFSSESTFKVKSNASNTICVETKSGGRDVIWNYLLNGEAKSIDGEVCLDLGEDLLGVSAISAVANSESCVLNIER